MPTKTPAAPKNTQMETEWRAHVTRTLERLEDGQESMRNEVSRMMQGNTEQHSDLTNTVAAQNNRIDFLFEKFEHAVEAANKKLEGRDKLIRALVAVIIFLGGTWIGVKIKIAELLKPLFGG